MEPDKQKRFFSPVFLRIALPAIITVVLFVTAIFAVILPALEKSFMDYKKLMIKELTETAWSILKTHNDLHLQGKLSLAQAQQEAIEHIEQLRYGPERKDYFWINDMQPKMIMHPYRKDLNGKDISSFTDPHGKKLFMAMVRLIETSGGGYVDYMWQWKDDPDRIVPKISYVKGFKPWGWIIGSGIYINDVHEELAVIRNKLTIISVIILGFVIAAAMYIIRQTMISEQLRKQLRDERTALIEALAISEEQYRSMVEYSSDWIWEMTPEGVYTYASPKAVELLGRKPEEVVGTDFFDYMVTGELDHGGKRLREIMKKGAPFTGIEIVCRHQDGRSIVIEKNGVPFFNDRHELIGYRGVARDISERKQAEDALRRSHTRLHDNLEETVKSLAMTAEKRDPYTAGHQVRVERLALAIALELGMKDNQLEGLHFAALLHDIGKISLPSEYLAKPTGLTSEERSIIKSHPESGYEILKNINFPWPVAEIVLQHHELLDGSGYPRGLQDQEIMIEAKIITIADVVEAMSSHRPYRPALGLPAALAEIRSGRGIKYHKEGVDACLYLMEQQEFDLDSVIW
ncbi:cache domain-containing protein [Desulforhopalus singaporensis]|uniref:PAS domain S-box-containing protein/HDIG domain-containing protein n=1 Tax=Desulforhopalus singaporensis TaxID=91360 RepID=A0A1H0UN58_9BACT|nr:HD domain-containing phosphohydrolase [Desulforhopalus singaporensis]SDP67515.1 PAS domain S-box-containing protein/HDIG domain-containing protein [Desulforhopalus singaporensis]